MEKRNIKNTVPKIEKLVNLNNTTDITNAIDSIANAKKYNAIASIAKQYCYNIFDLKNENIPNKKEIQAKMRMNEINLQDEIYKAYCDAKIQKTPRNTNEIKQFLKELETVFKAVGVKKLDIVNVITYEEKYNKEKRSKLSGNISQKTTTNESE